MSHDAEQAHSSHSTSESSIDNSKTLAEPFISNVLAYLGLGNHFVPEDAPLISVLSALRHPQWQVRAAGARKLGKLGERTSLDPLIAMLMHDAVTAVKVAAARALGELAEYAPLEPLIAALDDPADEVKEAASWALGELGEQLPTSIPLENLLNYNNSTVRAAAVRALGKVRAGASTDILVAALEDPNWQVREMAALALEKWRERMTRKDFKPRPEEPDG